MDTDELFSFLEDQNGGLEASTSASSAIKMDVDGEGPSGTPSQSKRKRRKQAQTNGSSTPAVVEEEKENQNKKARVKGPSLPGPTAQPIVLDEFETEQKREVNASAGLTGQVADSQRLELRHQVSSVI